MAQKPSLRLQNLLLSSASQFLTYLSKPVVEQQVRSQTQITQSVKGVNFAQLSGDLLSYTPLGYNFLIFS